MKKDFITVTPDSGGGNGKINVTAEKNTGASNRSSTITISGGGITKTITISQKEGTGDYYLNSITSTPTGSTYNVSVPGYVNSGDEVIVDFGTVRAGTTLRANIDFQQENWIGYSFGNSIIQENVSLAPRPGVTVSQNGDMEIYMKTLGSNKSSKATFEIKNSTTGKRILLTLTCYNIN